MSSPSPVPALHWRHPRPLGANQLHGLEHINYTSDKFFHFGYINWIPKQYSINTTEISIDIYDRILYRYFTWVFLDCWEALIMMIKWRYWQSPHPRIPLSCRSARSAPVVPDDFSWGFVRKKGDIIILVQLGYIEDSCN